MLSQQFKPALNELAASPGGAAGCAEQIIFRHGA